MKISGKVESLLRLLHSVRVECQTDDGSDTFMAWL